MYDIVLGKDAVRALERLTPQMKCRVIRALERIRANPFKGKRLRGELEGLFSLRVGEMRAVYELDTVKEIIVVHAIGSRGDIYKK